VPDSNGVTVVFPLFAIILRIRAFLAASMPTHTKLRSDERNLV